ncbi:MAG: Lrp/AsnC family transcriptional regulator [Candidatus Bathyarchaeota archaeon]|nr:Lrp/AsnC family transcriptional regulator [Candidatus Bathyarchaeota archaeon]
MVYLDSAFWAVIINSFLQLFLNVVSLAFNLDEKDKQILNLLQENARLSFTEIAKELEISEATVRYRVKKLVDAGVISKFTVLLDPRKIGYPTTGILMVKIAPEHFEEAAEKISNMSETRHVLQSTGDYDVVTVVKARSLEHLNEVRKKMELIPGVKELSLSASMRLIKIDPAFYL